MVVRPACCEAYHRGEEHAENERKKQNTNRRGRGGRRGMQSNGALVEQLPMISARLPFPLALCVLCGRLPLSLFSSVSSVTPW